MQKKEEVWLALDFETDSPNKHTAKIDSLTTRKFDIKTGRLGERKDYSWRDGGPTMPELCDLAAVLTSPTLPKVAHNAPYEMQLIRRMNIQWKGPFFCTYIMARHWRNDFPASDLKSLAWWLFGDTYEPLRAIRKWMHDQNLEGEDPDADLGFDMSKPPARLVQAYRRHDVDMTARIAFTLYPMVRDSYAFRLDTATLPLRNDMESHGIPIDVEYMERYVRLGNRRIKRNRTQATQEMGEDRVRGRSPTGDALREHLKDRGEKRITPTGKTKSDDPVLRDHKEDAAVRAVQRVRRDQTQVNTFAQNILAVTTLPEGESRVGTFHPNLMQSAAITLRFKARGMYGANGVITKGQVQNITRGRGIRDGFVALPGYWFMKLDLASIEARMFTAFMEMLIGEHMFADFYRKDESFSPYVLVLQRCAGVAMASKKHELYTPYKHGTLGRLYGSSAKRFSIQLRDVFDLDYSVDECADIYDSIDREFPFIKRFQRYVTRLVEAQGYIKDVFGMKYHVPVEEVYKAVAYVCQGCAGWVLKHWWVEVERRMQGFNCGDYLCSTVHDELDGGVSKAQGKRQARKRVKAYCDAARNLDVLFGLPIIAEASDLCDNWGEAG